MKTLSTPNPKPPAPPNCKPPSPPTPTEGLWSLRLCLKLVHPPHARFPVGPSYLPLPNLFESTIRSCERGCNESGGGDGGSGERIRVHKKGCRVHQPVLQRLREQALSTPAPTPRYYRYPQSFYHALDTAPTHRRRDRLTPAVRVNSIICCTHRW